MNIHNPNTSDPFDGMPPLDADLLPLLADLDRLGALDRAAAAPGLEARLTHASLVSLHGTQPTAAQVAELASLDRASAPRTLEDDVYAATVPTIREHAATAPRLVLHPAADRDDARRHVRPAWWSRSPVRLAAMIVFVAGAAIAVRVGTTSRPTTPSTDISERVKGEMDMLFAAMDSRSTSDNSTDSAIESDTDSLTNWLLDGASS